MVKRGRRERKKKKLNGKVAEELKAVRESESRPPRKAA